MSTAVWTIAWVPDPAGTAIIDGYQVWRDASPDSPMTLLGTTKANTMDVELPNAPVRVGITVVPLVGNVPVQEEFWKRLDLVANSADDFDVPNNVADFQVTQAGTRLVFTWTDDPSPHIARYEIREGSNWRLGRFVGSALPGQQRLEVGWASSGSLNFVCSAITNQGLESATAALATTTARQDPNWMRVGSVDESGGGFAGTKTNTTVVTGALQPTSLPADYANWTADYTTYTQPWWWTVMDAAVYESAVLDAGLVVQEMPEVELALDTIENTPASYADLLAPLYPEQDDTGDYVTIGTPQTWERVYYDGGLKDPLPLRIEISTTQTDPSGSPVWTSWALWVPGAEYKYWGVKFRLLFNTFWPYIFGEIQTLKFHRRRLNLKDEQTVVIGGTGGTSVSFTQPFTQAPVVPAPNVAGSAANFAVAYSISKTGCTIRAYAHDGVELGSGTVHVAAFGV